MISLFTFVTPPSPCSYLAEQTSQMEYDYIAEATAADYEARLLAGWRRFGRTWFRPRCPSCSRCVSLRIDVERFRANRSQRRCLSANADVTFTMTEPRVSGQSLDLHERYHEFQQSNVGWRERMPISAAEYAESFVDNPFPSEQWEYRLGRQLVGIGYVDAVSSGLSAIYFFHAPEIRERGPGTLNVLTAIAEAQRRKLPYVYLGYYVAGCRSLEYKANYGPAEGLDWLDAGWKPFVPPS